MNQSDSIAPAPKVDEKRVAVEDASDRSSQDVEKHGIMRTPVLKRKLKSRHLQMIAIGILVDAWYWISLLMDFQVGQLELVCSLDLAKRSPSRGLQELSLDTSLSGLSSTPSCSLSVKWLPIFPSLEHSQHTPHVSLIQA